MANTTNYSWETPDDTDLVKDGAAAIRTLGSAIDSTVFTNASAAIAKTIVDAKGDIIAATAADTVARLAVGANNTVLTADSSTATGLKWATPAGGGKVIQAAFTQNTATYSRSSTGTSDTVSLTITPTSATSTIFISCSAAVASDGNNNSREVQIKITDGTTTRTIHKTLSVYAATTYAYNLGVGGSVFFTSPSTSSTTYTLQFQTISAGNFEFYSPSLTIFEVGA